MKILIVADEESKKYWDYYEPGMLDAFDLILSCGDLSPQYLEFLVTMSNKDLLYVHGNHDQKYDENPPLGCISVEDRVFNYKGLRVLGLGGSMKYRDAAYMYTEREMARRARRAKRSIRKNGGFDILLTHAPAFGLNHGNDLAHCGFRVFNDLMDRYRPAYFIHGHIHKNYCDGYKKDDCYGETHVINASGLYELEIPDALLSPHCPDEKTMRRALHRAHREENLASGCPQHKNS